MQTETTSSQSPNRRSRLVTLLSLGVLIIAGWHLLRLVLTVQQWAFLSSYPELSPLYLLATGLIGSVAGIWVSWSLWHSKPWAARAARGFSLGYALYWWADRLLLQRSPIQENWFFPTLLTLIGLAFTFWATKTSEISAK